MGSDTSQPPGLVICSTESIRQFLISASKDLHLSPEHQQMASDLSSLPNVPYKLLRAVWSACDSQTRPNLVQLLAGSEFVFTAPKPREKSEELKARLKRLADLAERNAYEELVKDITPRKAPEEPFSSYKDQMGFGLHVVLTMFTGYLVGYAAFRALFSNSPVMNAAGGILGFVFGMLVETLLFIIKTSNHNLTPSKTTSKQKKNQ